MAGPAAVAGRPHRRDLLRDRALRRLYAVGWRVAARVPPRVVAAATELASRVAGHSRGPSVATLRANLAVATGSPVHDGLLRAALASHFRNVYEMLALPGWSAAAVLGRVSTVNESVLREAYAGPGAVVALPHSGNWDLAGAWACRSGMPVTTVAEQLADPDFAAFVAFRERLGMQVLSHRDPAAVSTLAQAVRSGRLVCLMADRDLGGSGVPVRWRDQDVRLPGGPAVVARRTGASLVPAVCRFTPDGMQIVFGAVVANRPGRDGLVAMTQEVADFFADTIAEAPADWHMLQPFFGRTP
ncbi:MAG: KDO2-lipid lauroyltransferase [Friedmanniella sp.]|nr:KDO2-lipid lauroyltransferase [Friedmanniella sp.]